MEIRIDDEGAGFDRTRSCDPLAPENRFRASGRGIFYMRRFMDEVEFASGRRAGRGCRLRKRLIPAPEAAQHPRPRTEVGGVES